MPRRRFSRNANREEELQKSVARHLDCKGLPWFHASPNVYRAAMSRWAPRHAAAKAGALGKRCGVKKGIPDNIILRTPPNFPEAKGVVFELKVKATVSPEQREWMEIFEEEGWQAFICRGFDEFEKMMERCGWPL